MNTPEAGPPPAQRPQPHAEALLNPGNGPAMLFALLLCGVLAAQYFVLPDFGLSYALSAEALKQGRWWTLLTHMFLHGGILHLLMNLSALVSLQRPARLELGPGGRGLAALGGLYLASGLAGALVYLAIHPGGQIPMLGASGAICGLWGAAARLASRHGELTRLNDRQVWLNVRNFALMNLILVLLISGPQFLLRGGEATGGIAWEGHLGGFLAGLLLVPLFQRWSGWTPPPPPQPPWWEIDPGPWGRGRLG